VSAASLARGATSVEYLFQKVIFGLELCMVSDMGSGNDMVRIKPYLLKNDGLVLFGHLTKGVELTTEDKETGSDIK
jgi:hypothetical protein